MARQLAFAALLVVASGNSGAQLPRGLDLELSAAEAERAIALAKEFEKDYIDGNFVSVNNITRRIQECDQSCPDRCWATSATMAASAFGWAGYCSEGEAAAAGHEGHEWFNVSCFDDKDPWLPETIGGTMTEIADAIGFLSGAKYTSVPNALQPTDLESALKIGPVVVGILWRGGWDVVLGGGNAITVSGVSGGSYTGHDPFGYAINTDYTGLLSYKPPYCKYPCVGLWDATSYPVAGPTVAGVLV